MIRILCRLLVVACAASASVAAASPNGVVISQVYGGGGNTGATYRNDFVELFNAGSAPVSLAGWSVQYASAAGSTWQVTPLTAVTLQPGQYYLVQEAVGAGGTTPLPAPDASGTIPMSATAGKVALLTSTTALTSATPVDARIVDLVGFGGAGFAEGAPTAAPSNTTAVLRAADGCTDTEDNASDFAVGAPVPRNAAVTPKPCGTVVNAPIVTTCPSFMTVAGAGGSGTMTATDADGTVNAVTLASPPPGIALGALTPAAGPGGVASVPVLVAATVPAGAYPLSLTWANDQSQSATCAPTVTVGGPVAIYTIQGAGATSAYAGRTVITQGVVTRVVNNGFYMQDATGDGDPGTSDGIFVFTSTAPSVVAGDLARVSATVVEFNTGSASNADTASHTITELSSVSSVVVVGRGFAVTPITVTLPLASRDDLERYEGMLVTLTGPFTVVQNAFLGQYGQVTLAALGRTETPTNRVRPGPAALALDADNKRRSIVMDDGLSTQYPNPTPFLAGDATVRAGDTTTSVTGVIDYGLATSSSADPGSWRIVPTAAPVFTRVNTRTTAPEDVGGTVRVASANVLNFFTTFTNGNTADGRTGQGCTVGASTSPGNCRGANNLAEFTRQRAKIVEELAGLNADAVGLMEIQNNGGVALQNLVDGLNAKLGAGTYAYVPDPAQGTGTDAIKVAMIYKPSRLALGGPSASDPSPIHNRPPLAQVFVAAGGQRFMLVVNHLKSKGCDGGSGSDADLGDLQGCFNATRVLQARTTRTWVASLVGGGAPPEVLLVGDFNAYAQEDPIVELTANGYSDQVARFTAFGYSYVFDGAAGRLDHALASPALVRLLARVAHWHVNADEPSVLDYNLENKQPACATCSPDFYTPTPYRASDHDPLVIGIRTGPVTDPCGTRGGKCEAATSTPPGSGVGQARSR